MKKLSWLVFFPLLLSAASSLAGVAPTRTLNGKVDGFDESRVFLRQEENVFFVPRAQVPNVAYLREGHSISIPVRSGKEARWRPTRRAIRPVPQEKAQAGEKRVGAQPIRAR